MIDKLILDVHRLGRTARAGASGHGLLILADFETFFLHNREVRKFNLKPYPEGDNLLQASSAVARVHSALDTMDDESKAQAYQAYMVC